MTKRYSFKELFWLTPFIFLGLTAIALSRPWPMFPPPQHSKMITDGQGEKVTIPLPVHVVGGGDYLELTHAPETLSKIGNARARIGFSKQLMSQIYPQLLQNSGLWTYQVDIETRLAQDDGATYFEWNAAHSRRYGLSAVTLAPKGGDFRETLIRVENDAISHEQQGESIIADYRQAYTDLRQELQPETLTDRPRTLLMGSSRNNWSMIWTRADWETRENDERIGVVNATIGFANVGREKEAERILAMNPDIIFGVSIEDFLNDPRWKGLKAVANRRVYGGGTGFSPCGPTWGLDASALALRMEAEIVHPDRLQPKMRQLTRDHFIKAYNYRLSDEEIDKMLGVEPQKNAPGFARFVKVSQVDTSSMNNRAGVSQ